MLIAGLHISPFTGEKDKATAIVGGLSDASSADSAKVWLKEALRKADIDGVTEIYDKCQDRAFNGMLFVKFSSSEARNVGIGRFKSSKSQLSEKRSYMNRDRPIQERAKFSFLLNLKRLLMEWGSLDVRFDEISRTRTIERTEILQVATEGSVFKLLWLSDEFSEWGLLMGDPKFKELVQTAKDKLANAGESLDKDEGKGKSA